MKTIFDLTKDYLSKLGYSSNAINELFPNKSELEIISLNLSNVNIISKNKPNNSKSHQSHIHVTGEIMGFFYDNDEISHTLQSTEDNKLEMSIIKGNVANLSKEPLRINQEKIDLIETYTYTKIAYRKDQSKQVQISKVRKDHDLFMQLRNNLYTNDLLIFIRFIGNGNLIVLGIPKEFYEPYGTFETDYLNNVTITTRTSIKSVLKSIESEYDTSHEIFHSDIISESIYQEQVQDIDEIIDDGLPQQKKDKAKLTTEKSVRDPRIGKSALVAASYKCEIDSNHETFTTKKGFNYVEAHHLIPISTNDDFPYSLDIKANIISVCPSCHAKLHYGRVKDIENIVSELFVRRKEALKSAGIYTTIEDLLKYYE